MRLDWFAAPFEAHGGTSGDGARRLLGQPNLDPLTVLVRETIQNSWDARVPDSEDPLEYCIGLRTVDEAERRVLREDIFGQNPEHGDLGLPEALDRRPLRLIEISDSGTSGLAGPVRADRTPAEGERTDFVDFIFNIGAARDTDLGGGTYGFGKTISYVVSRASTTIVSSCVKTDQGVESRLIASGIGSQFSVDQRRYTGRQWWGRLESDRIAPATGELARDLASALGLPVGRPGTRILIVDPELRDRAPEEAMEFLTSSILWHAWPKMLPPPSGGAPPMQISARLEGDDFPVPDPGSESRLKPFVTALQLVRAAQDGDDLGAAGPPPVDLQMIQCGRPKQDLGHLGLAFAPSTRGSPGKDGSTEEAEDSTDACPFEDHSHHIALMRQAELIVTYFEGPPSSVDGYQWAGAFRCLVDVDDHFAMAEPPAHEGWDPEFVTDSWGRTFVRVALREIKRLGRDFAAPAARAISDVSSFSTARIGDLLSGMIPSVEATGLSGGRGGNSSGRPGGGSRKRRSADLKIGRIDYAGDGVRTEFRVDLAIDADGRPSVVEVDLGVRNDTGRESSAPEGSVPPRLGSLVGPDGMEVSRDSGGCFRLPAGSGTAWTLTVHAEDLAALDLDIRAYVDDPEGEG